MGYILLGLEYGERGLPAHSIGMAGGMRNQARPVKQYEPVRSYILLILVYYKLQVIYYISYTLCIAGNSSPLSPPTTHPSPPQPSTSPLIPITHIPPIRPPFLFSPCPPSPPFSPSSLSPPPLSPLLFTQIWVIVLHYILLTT